MALSKLLQPKVLLLLICTLFLITRFYKISEIPPSVYWDEASIGYNAYSILQTGKDEWGEVFPIHFRAFGEFKLPVYIYATAVSVKLFGLNEFSVRLPAVLFSLGVVVLTYLLAKRLLNSESVALLASFFVTISPWFFIFSRTGYEATAGLMFFVLGICFFLQLKEKFFLLIPSVLSFILSMYSYNSFRIITPLTLLVLTFFYYDTLVYHSKRKLLVIVSVVLILLSLVPIIKLVRSEGGTTRLQAVGIFSSSNSQVLTDFTKNYLSHFSLNFLLGGDENRGFQQQDFGQLYLPEIIMLVLGSLFYLFYIICRKSKGNVLPLILILLAPIPAAITKESPHALRAISAIPFIQIISAMGIIYIKRFLPSRFFAELAISVLFLGFFVIYFNNFLTLYLIQTSQNWQYGYKKIFTDYQSQFIKYDRIIISDEYAQPYIFALFYLKYAPEKFRQEVIRNSIDQWGFSAVSAFDKFEFGKIDKLLSKKGGLSLIFASDKEKLPPLTPVSTVKFLDGTTAFWIYEL